MSSLRTAPDAPTELRLDYDDLVAGKLVIVIDGLPTVEGRAAVRPRTALATASNRQRIDRPSSPLRDEVADLAEALGEVPPLCTQLVLAAWKSREQLASELVEATIEEAPLDDAGQTTALTEYVKALLWNSMGRYRDALEAAEHACSNAGPGLLDRVRLELVEAAARSGGCTAATDALRPLEARTRTGADWSVAVWARSAALLGEDDAAEALYREAIERFDRAGSVVHLARARLVYGEWLRRENRRLDAREQLRAAYETLGGVGAEGFAERARRELLATGETARRRVDVTRGDLTPQEAQIARLARDGFSNPEIGAQLFISHRTVQYHLRKVFAKLQITSRNQLGRFPAGSLQSP